MIRIQNIPLPVGGDLEQLRRKAARTLGVRPGALKEIQLVRQSIDARKKQDVHYVYTVDVAVEQENGVLAACTARNVSLVHPLSYAFPEVKRHSAAMPVVVGMARRGCLPPCFWPGTASPAWCWSGDRTWIPARRMWSGSGRTGC